MSASLTYQYKQAWLSLKNKPGFIATVVSTMGITLGALICVLTLAYLLFFQPLPYPEQERLHQVHYIEVNEHGVDQENFFSYPAMISLYEKQNVFDEAAMIFFTKNVLASLPHQPTLPVAFITPELMSMLDVPMHMGRRFDEREAVGTHHPVAVLNYETWYNDFAADPDILNKKVEFKGRQFQVIGVTAKAFVEPQFYRQGTDTALWFTWDFNLGQKFIDRWDGIYDNIAIIAKLKPSITALQAEQTLSPVINTLWKDNSSDVSGPLKDWTVRIGLQPVSSVLLGESGETIYFLLAGVFGLLLIACANITNLFISRTAEQQRNLAIQAALGAKKSQLAQLIFTEASLLMMLSFVVSLLASSVGFYLFKHHLAGLLPRVDELVINHITFLSALLLAAIAALLFAYISSQMVNYRALNTQLQSSGKGTGIQVSKKIRQRLITCQVAIATVLIFANLSLFTNALEKINTPSGLVLDDIMHASFSVSSPTPLKEGVVLPIMQDLKQQLLALPQVDSVDRSYCHLATNSITMIEDPRGNESIKVEFKPVGDQYFSMAQQALIAGNYFSNSDSSNPNILDVILSEALAKRLMPDEENVIGKTFLWGDDTATIVGVVKAVKYPGYDGPVMQMYAPVLPMMTKMNIKLKPNQSLTRKEVVAAIKAVTPLYALYGLEHLKETEANMLFSHYVTAITSAALAIITLLLATIGIYGILSYGTQMRRFEFGTRMAIGAKAKDLIILLIKDNTPVILSGILASSAVLLILYIAFYSAITQFIGLSTLMIYFVTLIAIALLCLFACYWPLRQYIKQPAVYSLRGSE